MARLRKHHLLAQHPTAQRREICGVLHILLACEECGLRVWTNADNEHCFCNDCVCQSLVDAAQRDTKDERVFHVAECD